MHKKYGSRSAIAIFVSAVIVVPASVFAQLEGPNGEQCFVNNVRVPVNECGAQNIKCNASSDPKIESYKAILDTLRSKQAGVQGINNDLQTYLDKLIDIQNQTKVAHDVLMNNYSGNKQPLEDVQKVANSLRDTVDIYKNIKSIDKTSKLARKALQSKTIRELITSPEANKIVRSEIEGFVYAPGKLVSSAVDISNYLTKLITNSELTPLEEGAESLKRASDKLTNYGFETGKAIRSGNKLSADNQKTIAGFDIAISTMEKRLQEEGSTECPQS